MAFIEVTNPGVINAANEAFDGYGHPDQCVTVSVPGEPLDSFDGGLYRPGGAPADYTANNVDGQVYGVGNPINVYP